MTTNPATRIHYSIGQAARTTGFSIDTLRYYEKIGILENIERTSTGQRRFTDEDVHWLEMVKCLRDTGMSIENVLRFAQLVREGDHTVAQRVALLSDHQDALDSRVADLLSKREQISAKIEFYRTLD